MGQPYPSALAINGLLLAYHWFEAATARCCEPRALCLIMTELWLRAQHSTKIHCVVGPTSELPGGFFRHVLGFEAARITFLGQGERENVHVELEGEQTTGLPLALATVRSQQPEAGSHQCPLIVTGEAGPITYTQIVRGYEEQQKVNEVDSFQTPAFQTMWKLKQKELKKVVVWLSQLTTERGTPEAVKCYKQHLQLIKKLAAKQINMGTSAIKQVAFTNEAEELRGKRCDMVYIGLIHEPQKSMQEPQKSVLPQPEEKHEPQEEEEEVEEEEEEQQPRVAGWVPRASKMMLLARYLAQGKGPNASWEEGAGQLIKRVMLCRKARNLVELTLPCSVTNNISFFPMRVTSVANEEDAHKQRVVTGRSWYHLVNTDAEGRPDGSRADGMTKVDVNGAGFKEFNAIIHEALTLNIKGAADSTLSVLHDGQHMRVTSAGGSEEFVLGPMLSTRPRLSGCAFRATHVATGAAVVLKIAMPSELVRMALELCLPAELVDQVPNEAKMLQHLTSQVPCSSLTMLPKLICYGTLDLGAGAASHALQGAAAVATVLQGRPMSGPDGLMVPLRPEVAEQFLRSTLVIIPPLQAAAGTVHGDIRVDNVGVIDSSAPGIQTDQALQEPPPRLDSCQHSDFSAVITYYLFDYGSATTAAERQAGRAVPIHSCSCLEALCGSPLGPLADVQSLLLVALQLLGAELPWAGSLSAGNRALAAQLRRSWMRDPAQLSEWRQLPADLRHLGARVFQTVLTGDVAAQHVILAELANPS